MKQVRTFLLMLAIFGLSVISTNAQFGGGDGTDGSPYQISTAAHLEELATYVNDGDVNYNDKFYILTTDIDLSDYQSGAGWTPIGNGDDTDKRFKGNFNGNGKIITGLKINNTTLGYLGLFGSVDGGIIKNVGIEDADIVSQYSTSIRVGSIAGYISVSSSISNCYATGIVDCTNSGGNPYIGGLVGTMINGEISNCYSAVSVSSDMTGNLSSQSAGIVAVANNSVISNCYCIGAVSTTAVASGVGHRAAGIAGNITNTTISNCAALNPSIYNAGTNFGRVIGNTAATLTNNIGFDEMLNPDGNTTWDNVGLSLKDGADFTKQDIYVDGTLGGRFSDSDGWTIVNGYLPGLFGKSVEMPWYLFSIEEIWTAADLKALADYINAGNGNATVGIIYVLMDNIDLSDYQADAGWIPIGNNEGSDTNKRFKGNFNGNNKVITGLKINNTTFAQAGLFGYVDGGSVTNLGIEDVDIVNAPSSGIAHAGSVSGIFSNNSVMSNCYATGSITCTATDIASYVGGLSGTNSNSSEITHCYSEVKVTSSATGTTGSHAGGIAGYIGNLGTISNCYSTGSVSGSSASANVYVGGLIGNGIGIVSRCYATGAVISFGSENAYAGGIIGGSSSGTVEHSAALNPSIICSGSTINFGRVSGNSGTLLNNIAFDKMLDPEGDSIWVSSDLNGIDFTAQEVNEDGTLGNRFTDTNGWTSAEGYLPGLFGNLVDMPLHLQIGSGITNYEFGITNLVVYPNPTSGQMSVVSSQMSVVSSEMSVVSSEMSVVSSEMSVVNSEMSEVSIEILDIAGRIVHRVPCTVNREPFIVNRATVEIDISHLSNGIYFVKVGKETIKIVKQ